MRVDRIYQVHQIQQSFGADFERIVKEIISGQASVSGLSSEDWEVLGLEETFNGGPKEQISAPAESNHIDKGSGTLKELPVPGQWGRKEQKISDEERAEIAAALDFLNLEQVNRLLDQGFLNVTALRNFRIRLAFGYMRTRMPARNAVEALADEFCLGLERIKDIVYKGA